MTIQPNNHLFVLVPQQNTKKIRKSPGNDQQKIRQTKLHTESQTEIVRIVTENMTNERNLPPGSRGTMREGVIIALQKKTKTPHQSTGSDRT